DPSLGRRRHRLGLRAGRRDRGIAREGASPARAPHGGLPSMTPRVVLTAIGDDRPGLVEEVSGFVLERGGSIEESRMLNLHGQFAIAVLLAGSRDALAAIEQEQGELEQTTSLHVRVTAVHEEGRPAPRETYRI